MGEFTPTPGQKEAMTSVDRSLCVRAGAGTGKTSVLVGRYMELLRRKLASVHEIAAITYTEKAAKVMKDRIRTACARRETDAAHDDDAEWWRRQRIDLETARISTIHGFCSRILGERPVEAGVDPHFTVLEALEQSILLEQCIDEVVRCRLDREDEPVLRLCRELGVPAVRGMLVRMIGHRDEASQAVKTIEAKSDAEVIASWERLLVEAQTTYLANMLDEVARDKVRERLEDAGCLDASDRFASRRDEAVRLLRDLAGTGVAKRKIELAAALRDVVYGLRGGSSRKWSGEDLKTVKAIFGRLKDMLDGVPGGGFDRGILEVDRKALALTRTLASLYGEAADAYSLRKAAEGYLDFEDLLISVRDLLAASKRVRDSVRKRCRYLLVDELQDSALVERNIIMSIVADAAEEGKSKTVRIAPGRLFVVGDDKQSIYRFRGAEVSVFNHFTETMMKEKNVVTLDVSFRTVPRGVAFANDLFGHLMGREPKTASYASSYFDLEAHRTEDNEFLEVMIPEPVADEKSPDARAREARMIAARVLEMVERKEQLVWDDEHRTFRPVEFGDVAILFRAMTQVHIYEHEFREAGLPYYILAGRGFYRRQEITDLLTMLKAIERPRDQVSLVGALRSPLFGISDETLFFMSRTGSVREGLTHAEDVADITDDQRRGLIDARQILAELTEIKNRVPISKLLGTILERTGYDATLLAQFMGKQKFANVEKLIDVARSFEAKGLFTLDDFLRTVERFVDDGDRESERAAEEESSNVVRVMSVHRAKGMEFPVVFVADCSHSVRRRPMPLMLDRRLGLCINVESDEQDEAKDHPALYDMIAEEERRRDAAENLRIFYVALTRARDHLVVSGCLGGRRLAADAWLKLLADRYQLIDDEGIAESLVFGEEQHAAPVRTKVPDIPTRAGGGRRRAGWKVVRRLTRLAARIDEARSAPTFEGARRIEPMTLNLDFKRRFVPSEFAEYRYCPERYRLSKIAGVLPSGVGRQRGGARPGGALLGTVVHRILAAWDWVSDETLARTARRVLRGMEFAQAEEAEALMDDAVAMIARADGAGAFAEIASSDERHTEYPLAARVDGFVIDGIIDSVHRLADGTFEIVDYKTDRVETDAVAEVAEHYEPQVASYAVALAKSGRQVSRVSLIFVRLGEKYTWACDAKQLKSWEELLSSIVADIRSGRFEQRAKGPCRCDFGWVCGRESGEVGDLDLV